MLATVADTNEALWLLSVALESGGQSSGRWGEEVTGSLGSDEETRSKKVGEGRVL